MEQRKVCEEAQLLRQKSSQIFVVEVDPANRLLAGVVGSIGAEDTGVVADVGTNPACRYI